MRSALAALLVLVSTTAVLAQPAERPKPGDMVNNPPYAHWSQFPVGTSVTTKEIVTLADGNTVETLVTSKLVAKSKDRLTVETVVTAADASKQAGAAEQTKTVTDYPAKVKFEHTHSPDSAGYSVTEGKEIVDVKGKQVEAEWVEATTTNGDETTVEKIWTAQDVPGGIVKQTMVKKKGGKVSSQSAMQLVNVSTKPAAKSPAKKP
jgi:hypothetical protein